MSVNLRLLSGLAVGYVLGTKAGRERYEQLLDLGRRVAGSDAGRQLQAGARQAKERAGAVIGGKASEGVAKVSELIHSDDEPTPDLAVSEPMYGDELAPDINEVEPMYSDELAPDVAAVTEPNPSDDRIYTDDGIYTDDEPTTGTTPPSV
jgi:hypothetical protein